MSVVCKKNSNTYWGLLSLINFYVAGKCNAGSTLNIIAVQLYLNIRIAFVSCIFSGNISE